MTEGGDTMHKRRYTRCIHLVDSINFYVFFADSLLTLPWSYHKKTQGEKENKTRQDNGKSNEAHYSTKKASGDAGLEDGPV